MARGEVGYVCVARLQPMAFGQALPVATVLPITGDCSARKCVGMVQRLASSVSVMRGTAVRRVTSYAPMHRELSARTTAAAATVRAGRASVYAKMNG